LKEDMDTDMDMVTDMDTITDMAEVMLVVVS
jgi:hypothetical protein